MNVTNVTTIKNKKYFPLAYIKTTRIPLSLLLEKIYQKPTAVVEREMVSTNVFEGNTDKFVTSPKFYTMN
jgi:hypothetical protein